MSRRKNRFGLVRAWRSVFTTRRRNRRRLPTWRALDLAFRRPPGEQTFRSGSSLIHQFLALTIRAPVYLSMSRHEKLRHSCRVEQHSLRQRAANIYGVRRPVLAGPTVLSHQKPGANSDATRLSRQAKSPPLQRSRSIIRLLRPRESATAVWAAARRVDHSAITDLNRSVPGYAANAIALTRRRAGHVLASTTELAARSTKSVGRQHALAARHTVSANSLQLAVPPVAGRAIASSNEHHSHYEHRRVLPIEIVYRDSKQSPATTSQSRERSVPSTEMPVLDVSRLSSEVLRRITKQVRVERERLGRS